MSSHQPCVSLFLCRPSNTIGGAGVVIELVASNVVVVVGAVEEVRGFQKVYGILNHNLFKH